MRKWHGHSSHRLLDASMQGGHHLLNTAQKLIGRRQHRRHLSSGVGLGGVFIFVSVLLLLKVLGVVDVLVDVLKKVDQHRLHANHRPTVVTPRGSQRRILVGVVALDTKHSIHIEEGIFGVEVAREGWRSVRLEECVAYIAGQIGEAHGVEERISLCQKLSNNTKFEI
ncbi:hypothetical protein TYRP_020670 [Tyrophagus putrescentiae]|nr:hypothetical protein TYRP_020670 [Tyrophagus putrescentiae]